MTTTTYETDFYGWTQQQVAFLKAGMFNALDLANIIEEIECIGRSEKRELAIRLSILLLHLLKWSFQPSRRGVWSSLCIDEQRLRFTQVLRENPSLESRFADMVVETYRLAVIKAAKETGLSTTSFPKECPWNLQQITDSEFYPD